MVFPLYSGVLSNGESMLFHNKLTLASHERYSYARGDMKGNLMVRMVSSKWNFRYLELLKTKQLCKGLGRRYSTLFSVRMDHKTSSSRRFNTVLCEVTS